MFERISNTRARTALKNCVGLHQYPPTEVTGTYGTCITGFHLEETADQHHLAQALSIDAKDVLNAAHKLSGVSEGTIAAYQGYWYEWNGSELIRFTSMIHAGLTLFVPHGNGTATIN